MDKEIRLCCKLWADQIRGGTQDMGDAIGSGMAEMVKSFRQQPSEEQLARFQEELYQILKNKIQKWDCWHVNNPVLGSHYRSLYTDYNPDKELSEAAKSSGIDDAFIPIKSLTCIYPGYVEYSFGYSAKTKRMQVEG